MEYAVLGGGALGLLTAYRLAQAGQSVIVFEQEKIAGGLASGFQVEDGSDIWLEKFYHHLFRTDKTAIKVIQEMGLGDRLEWLRPRTVSLLGGEIYQLDSPLTLLQFKPWRMDERLRVGAVLSYLKFVPPQLLEGKRADPWLRRWLGSFAFKQLWRNKFKIR